MNLNSVALGLHGGTFLGGEPVTRGQWNHFVLNVNMSNDFVSAYMNGNLIASAFNPSPATSLTSFVWGVNSDPGTDTAFIDNISITSSAVPEPSSVVLAGIATGMMVLTSYVRHSRQRPRSVKGQQRRPKGSKGV